MALEAQRQHTLNEMSKKQSMIEALKQDLRKAEADIDEALVRPAISNVGIRLQSADANTPAERMRAMMDLTAEHAQRLAQTRAESMSAVDELKRLDEGLWKYSADNKAGAGMGLRESTQSGGGKAAVSLSTNLQEIIDSITSSDGMRDQQKKLDSLKKEAAKELYGLNIDFDSIEGGKRGGEVPEVLGRKDGSLRDCLDEWLGVGKSSMVVPESSSSLLRPMGVASTDERDELTSTRRQLSGASMPSSQNQFPNGNNAQPKLGPAGQPMAAVASVDSSTNELIITLQEEIRKLKETQQSQQQQQPQQQQQHQPGPYQQPQPGHPYYHPMANPGMMQNPYGSYLMNPMYPVPPSPMQFPQPYFNPYQQQQPQQPDPHQQMLVQQMQKMAEQMERENQKLMGQLKGGSSFDGPSSDYAGDRTARPRGGRGLGADPFDINAGSNVNNNNNNNQMRQKRSDQVSRVEQKYQDDIRLMQLEFERLKQQQELEDYKYQLDKTKAQRLAEDEHNEWLIKQKQDLQVMKMKQAIAKEQRLLQAQTSADDGFVNNFPDGLGGAGGLPAADSPTKRKMASMLFEEAGCGSSKVPLDLSKGASALADGVLMSPQNQTDELFRLALGVYDAKGKNIAKLVASEWQPWSDISGERASFNFLPPGALRRIVKVSNKDGEESALVLGAKILIELQCRTSTGPQRTAGWAVMPLVFEEPSGAKFVQRGLWKLCLRRGMSDPACNPIVAPEDPLPGWILVRIGDIGELNTQSSFDPQSYVGFKTEEDVMKGYVDPLALAIEFASDGAAGGVGTMVREQQTPQGQRSRPSSALDEGIKRPEAGRNSRPPTGMGMIEEEPATAAGAVDNYKSPVSKGSRADDKSNWVLGTAPGPAAEKYQRGDGIDIYIDSALFLPDNCTVTRLVLKIFTMEKEMIGSPFEMVSPPLTLAKSPVYKLKAELRGAVFNTSAIGLIRIDTLDSNSLLSVSVGYACFKLFCSRERVQPKTSNDGNCFVNTGAFQLPLFGGRMSALDAFDDKMLNGMQRIPCASVLVRVFTAPRSADGLAVLSRDDFAREEWSKMGLDIPAPLYSTGAYHGILCEPTEQEKICYAAKAEVAASVDATVSQALSSRTELPPPLTPKPSGGHESELRIWLASLLLPAGELRRTMDMSLAVPYSLDAGLSVSVDMLYGMPEISGGMFSAAPSNVFKVIYSIVPPGLFYKDPPLSEGVRFTKSEDYTRPAKHPIYLDGFNDFFPSQLDENVYLIMDVRTIRIDPPRNKQSDTVPIIVEPAVLEKSYWAMLPLAKERTPGQGFRYVASGTFQVPLVKGPVPVSDVFSSENPLQTLMEMLGSKNKSGLKLADGASIIVRVMNPLLRVMFENDFAGKPPEAPINILSGPGSYFRRILDAAAGGSTGAALARPEKFAFEGPKSLAGKTMLQQLPRDQDPKKLSKLINKEFSSKTAINLDA